MSFENHIRYEDAVPIADQPIHFPPRHLYKCHHPDGDVIVAADTPAEAFEKWKAKQKADLGCIDDHLQPNHIELLTEDCEYLP